MPYLRVDCYICDVFWNYYDKKIEPYPQTATTAAVQYLAGICPNCGGLGIIRYMPKLWWLGHNQ